VVSSVISAKSSAKKQRRRRSAPPPCPGVPYPGASLPGGLVAVGVFALPVPAVAAHLLNAVFRLPAQLLLGLGGVAPALGNVAGAARVDDVGQLPAAGLAEGVDHIQHAVA